MVRAIAWAALGAASLFFLAGSGGAQKADPQTGKALYERFGCFACHGHAGGGGMTAGPPLAGRGFDADYIAKYTRAPKGVMPPYRSSVLSDAQLAAIARHIVSFPGAKFYTQVPKLARLSPKPLTSKPLPGDTRPSPARQFAANCAMCHGAAGQGATAPGLLQEAGKRSVEQTMALLRQPPNGMPKLTPEPIAEDELPALAQYVHQLGK